MSGAIGNSLKALAFCLIVLFSSTTVLQQLVHEGQASTLNTASVSGVNFDHVVIIAMENQNFASVMGTGTGTSNAPFISSILNSGHSVTFPNNHSYGNRPGPASISGCSAGCYAALDAGTFSSGSSALSTIHWDHCQTSGCVLS